MKKALLTTLLAAALVATPLATTAATAAPASQASTSPATGVHLHITGALRTATLSTPSGNVSVQWGQQDGPGAKADGWFFILSRTHPARKVVVFATSTAGRNAIVALLRSDAEQLAAGSAAFAEPGAFVKAIRSAGKHR